MSAQSSASPSGNGRKYQPESCVSLALSVMNFVVASQNIAFAFSCLMYVPEWVPCCEAALCGRRNRPVETG
jgi:hypothetical protein